MKVQVRNATFLKNSWESGWAVINIEGKSHKQYIFQGLIESLIHPCVEVLILIIQYEVCAIHVKIFAHTGLGKYFCRTKVKKS